MKRLLALPLLLVLVAAEGAPPKEAPKEKPTTSTEKAQKAAQTPPAKDQFQGFLVAANATDVYAPEFVFRVRGWSSDWGGRKLVELAADGKAVKAGDVVARFEFGAEDALQWINSSIQEAEAHANQNEIAGAQALESLQMALRRRKMDAATAALNLERAPALSRLQADALAVVKRAADFEVDAAEQQLASATATWAADKVYREQNLAALRDGRTRYDYFLNRFTVRAAKDGVVRHAFNARERRKIQKGDGVQAGMRILSLAQDDTLAVRFFVPEGQASGVVVGSRVAVQLPTSAELVDGVVSAVDFFPQEIGFLLENEALPNGREKAIQVKATLTKAPPTLAAGTEVRVKLVGPPAQAAP